MGWRALVASVLPFSSRQFHPCFLSIILLCPDGTYEKKGAYYDVLAAKGVWQYRFEHCGWRLSSVPIQMVDEPPDQGRLRNRNLLQ